MENNYLLKYSVRGIKSLEKEFTLSFYKNTISKPFEAKGYNVKGIYGPNGSGKTGVVSSVKILKNIIVDNTYLNNRLTQMKLQELVNKKANELEYDVEYLTLLNEKSIVYRYQLLLGKDSLGKYVIQREVLSKRMANSHNSTFSEIFRVSNGELIIADKKGEYSDLIQEKSKNLLSDASLSSVFIYKIFSEIKGDYLKDSLVKSLIFQYFFADNIYVFLDAEDDHTAFVFSKAERKSNDSEDMSLFEAFYKHINFTVGRNNCVLRPQKMRVPKDQYVFFAKQVEGLRDFLKVFKTELKDISIEGKEDQEYINCELIMNYKGYEINSEFESTGIKKLITLYSYFEKMMEGGIVFIDEMDSNLHDVYLCALIEFLMEHAKGQICFTTHNIGPMDVLKKNKKSIDFLSFDGNIYPWVKNGNYSPSNLYREGMIEGSPFNIDSFDFLRAFGGEED